MRKNVTRTPFDLSPDAGVGWVDADCYALVSSSLEFLGA